MSDFYRRVDGSFRKFLSSTFKLLAGARVSWNSKIILMTMESRVMLM